LAFTIDSGWLHQNWSVGHKSGFDKINVGLAGSPGRREHCVDLLDHPLPIGGVLLRSGTRNQHGAGQDGDYCTR
jgi:hypothetical protein